MNQSLYNISLLDLLTTSQYLLKSPRVLELLVKLVDIVHKLVILLMISDFYCCILDFLQYSHHCVFSFILKHFWQFYHLWVKLLYWFCHSYLFYVGIYLKVIFPCFKYGNFMELLAWRICEASDVWRVVPTYSWSKLTDISCYLLSDLPFVNLHVQKVYLCARVGDVATNSNRIQ